VSFKNILLFL